MCDDDPFPVTRAIVSPDASLPIVMRFSGSYSDAKSSWNARVCHDSIVLEETYLRR